MTFIGRHCPKDGGDRSVKCIIFKCGCVSKAKFERMCSNLDEIKYNIHLILSTVILQRMKQMYTKECVEITVRCVGAIFLWSLSIYSLAEIPYHVYYASSTMVLWTNNYLTLSNNIFFLILSSMHYC